MYQARPQASGLVVRPLAGSHRAVRQDVRQRGLCVCQAAIRRVEPYLGLERMQVRPWRLVGRAGLACPACPFVYRVQMVKSPEALMRRQQQLPQVRRQPCLPVKPLEPGVPLHRWRPHPAQEFSCDLRF